MTEAKAINCYFCHKPDDGTLIEKVMPVETKTGKVRNYRRNFHADCLPQYLESGERMPKPKAVAKPKTLNTEEVHHCYYCMETIESVNDIAWKKFPLDTNQGRKWYNRKLHVNCLIKYSEEIQDIDLLKRENDSWELCYEYFRKEFLGLPVTTPLQQHEIRRLLGLRVGNYYPRMNTRILPRGYSFETILVTMKVVKPKIQSYLTTTNFANHKHRIDGILRFIVGEINDVQKRMDMQAKSNEKLKNDVVTETFDYKSDLKRKESGKIKNDIDIDDLGGLF